MTWRYRWYFLGNGEWPPEKQCLWRVRRNNRPENAVVGRRIMKKKLKCWNQTRRLWFARKTPWDLALLNAFYKIYFISWIPESPGFRIESWILAICIRSVIQSSSHFLHNPLVQSVYHLHNAITPPPPLPFRLPIMLFQVTSSGNMRVKSYTVAMVTPAWCLVGKHFITSFIVTLFFLVGGGCRIRAGAFGGKPKVSICEKLTAACWQEHVKMMMVSRWLSWSAVVTEDGKPWSPSPSLTG